MELMNAIFGSIKYSKDNDAITLWSGVKKNTSANEDVFVCNLPDTIIPVSKNLVCSQVFEELVFAHSLFSLSSVTDRIGFNWK